MDRVVSITVHERTDQPGYTVRLVSDGHMTRWPCESFASAEALALAAKAYLDVGLPLDALMGDALDEAEQA